MSAALAAVLLPFLAAGLLGLGGSPRAGRYVVLAAAAAMFLLGLAVLARPAPGWLHPDALGRIFGVLAGFLCLCHAMLDLAAPRLAAGSSRRQLVLGLVLSGCTLLGLYADNIFLFWLALEAATIALLCGRPDRGAPASALAAAGILLALFGSLAASLAGGGASFAMLAQASARTDAALMPAAFLCLLSGYGIQAVLASRPAAGLAGFSGLLPGTALLGILRFRHMAPQSGAWLLALGLAALLLAGAGLWRRRDISGFAGIGQNGLALFAFGLGGAPAVFAGLLHLLLNALLRGVLPGRNGGWPRALGVFALAGLPPSPLFVSEFLIVSQAVQRAPWCSVPLGIGLVLGGVAVCRLAEPPAPGQFRFAPHEAIAGLLLLAALVLAYAMPWPLVRALSAVAAGLQ